MSPIATRYGAMEIIRSDDVISRSLCMYGEWAQQEIDLMARFITPGACVLDVGAFIGTHTLAFAHMVGAHGRVIAFEPRREIFRYLQRNIDANGFTQVQAHHLAIGRTHAELALQALDLQHAGNLGGMSLAVPHDAPGGDQYLVSIGTLDRLTLPPVDLIKLDVEGMEGDVLEGARDLILRDQPIVFAECNSMEAGRGMIDFARASGYRIFGAMSAAYNVANFKNESRNIFGAAKELGLLMVDAERVAFCRQLGLPEIVTCDDLACLLLAKPQYYVEVLQSFCETHGVQFALPAAGRLEGSSVETKPTVDARVAEVIALVERLGAPSAASDDAKGLASVALGKLQTLHASLAAELAAVDGQRGLASQRQKEIEALTARVAEENAALAEAQYLAFDRLEQIAARDEELRFLRARVATLQLLEETRAVRLFRKLGLLREQQ